jgi:hypothetical protein
LPQDGRCLGVPRRSARQAQLSADPPGSLEENDGVARACGFCRGGETGRPRTDDGDTRRAGDHHRRRQDAFAPRAGILRAGDRRPGVVVGDAGVAADAAEEFLEPALARLQRQLRVGDERARHPDGVGTVFFEQPLGLQRVDDPRGRNKRPADTKGPRPGRDRVFDDGRRRDDARRAEIGGRVAQGDTDVVHRLRDGGSDRGGRSGVGAQADADGEPRG